MKPSGFLDNPASGVSTSARVPQPSLSASIQCLNFERS
jgi:hypothetical protein